MGSYEDWKNHGTWVGHSHSNWSVGRLFINSTRSTVYLRPRTSYWQNAGKSPFFRNWSDKLTPAFDLFRFWPFWLSIGNKQYLPSIDCTTIRGATIYSNIRRSCQINLANRIRYSPRCVPNINEYTCAVNSTTVLTYADTHFHAVFSL